MKTILVTGGAGFIGSNLIDELLLNTETTVYCIDNFDPYYAPEIKKRNIAGAIAKPTFHLVDIDIAKTRAEDYLKKFQGISFDAIIHLAARAGVRPSIANATAYYETNVMGTLALLEFAKIAGIPKFVFASSSSIYGKNPNTPWKEKDLLLQPISPYGATKLAGEDMGAVYSELYNIQFNALRLFTVYGPRQRPDLAIHQFYDLIHKQKPIALFGDGSTKRDYTFVSDIVAGIIAALEYNKTKYAVFNLGNSRQVTLIEMVQALETSMHTKAIINWQPEQPGDVPQTFADISTAGALLQYHPKIQFEEGIERFVRWKAGADNK